jgi:hypothetical protein
LTEALGKVNSLLYCNIATGELQTSLASGIINVPTLTAGDTIQWRIRTFENYQGNNVEKDLKMAGARISLSRPNATPTGGEFALRVSGGGVITDMIRYDASETLLTAKLQSILAGSKAVWANGGWLVSIEGASQTQPLLEVAKNTLTPECFLRLTRWYVGTTLFQHIRFVQSPLAFSDNFSLRLPIAPSISPVRDGGYDPVTNTGYDEVQELEVPSEFRGTYVIKRGVLETPVLDVNDGMTEIQDALAKIAGTGGSFNVTNPSTYKAHIQFKGALGSTDQPLLQAIVKSAPQGDISIFLPLTTVVLRQALNDAKEEGKDYIEAQLQLEVDIIDDPQTPSIFRPYTLFNKTVKIVDDGVWGTLSTEQRINWQIPPEPVTYVPFSRDQIITGSQHYTSALFVQGASSANAEFQVNHNLNTDSIHVSVRQNQSNGRLLQNGVDYEVTIISANAVKIETAVATNNDVLAVTITSAGPNSAFLAHRHTINDIDFGGDKTLAEYLIELSERVEAVEAIMPQTSDLASKSSKTGFESTCPPKVGVYGVPTNKGAYSNPINSDKTPYAFNNMFKAETGFAADEVAKIKKIPKVFRAIHDATAVPFVSSYLSNHSANIGVFQNTGDTNISIPNAQWIKGQILKPDEYVACDGEHFYLVERKGSTFSYYPSAYNVTLFTFGSTDELLTVNRLIDATWSVQHQSLYANVASMVSVVCETGKYEPSGGSNYGANLEYVNYDKVVFESILRPSSVSQTVPFGVRIGRNIAEILQDKCVYGVWSGAEASKPATANFALRVRLAYFDCEDMAGATGLIGYSLLGGVKDGDSKPAGENAKIVVTVE